MKPTPFPSAAPTPEGQTAILAFDVSKAELHVFSVFRRRELVHRFPNRTAAIEKNLVWLRTQAQEVGAKRCLVVAESTGIYHEPLMRAARQLGMQTALVSPEAVAKMRVIETNDTGKTDVKDPRVIHTLARMGKTLRHRPLSEPYSLLRYWNAIYDVAECQVVEAKGAAHNVIRRLFPDFRFKKDFLFGRSGRALVRRYGANPYRIVRAGSKRFTAVMRREAKGIRARSIELLLEDARASARNAVSPRKAELLEFRLQQIFEDLEREERRKEAAKEAMEPLYEEARQLDPCLPVAEKGLITTLHLARIVGETGPLGDFDSWRQLLRYSGLNLRERQSGTYRGKTRISKKGRWLLRKILSQVVLPLVKRDAIYGPRYHHKKEVEKMPGSKAITAISRHFLRMLWGCYRSGGAFVVERIFVCESQFPQAA